MEGCIEHIRLKFIIFLFIDIFKSLASVIRPDGNDNTKGQREEETNTAQNAFNYCKNREPVIK